MRLGLLGGTFDPIHLGHLLLAEHGREALGLDRVLLVPAHRPPHKPHSPLSPYEDRLRMVQLALENVEGLQASDLERDPVQPSFTVQTLRRCRASAPEGTELWLLLGSDSLRELSGWREPEAIQALAHLAVYPRPSAAHDTESPPEVTDSFGGQVQWISGPRLSLSSSEIRQRVAEGRSIRFLVPESVRLYIEERGLYRNLQGMDRASLPGGASDA